MSGSAVADLQRGGFRQEDRLGLLAAFSIGDAHLIAAGGNSC
ncbi:hypothetical protein Q0590_36970 [Rhodocytophaga aerolata]|uniref:Uncharacterized protein n=1 Tax=Rhodocytophaga aerolata TaxID=455078 RepID=A0ABT8RII2_9BACT|nr:hypothetical protein [Rhodocytophaga aerolata]MDO1451921.1 hypothetical protein [Rhodocytophaga aerolata]